MSATSADVARLAGVSRATVSQVLNGHSDRFAVDTAEKVKAAAKELEYQPSAAGRALRRGSSDVVIALLPHTTFGSNLQDLFEQMSHDLAAHGFTLVLRISSPSTSELDRVVTGMKPAAVFSLAPFTPDERAVLDRRQVLAIDPPSVSQIDHNRAIGELQAEALIERGHTRLAYAHMQDAREDPFGFAREEGMRAVALAHELPDIAVVRVDIDLASALAALDALDTTPVAIACYNDDVAMALLSAAHTRNLVVPADVALIGMDHTPLSRIAVPALTTIEYDLNAAARYATVGLLRSLGAGVPTVSASPVELSIIPGGTI
jgi:DNA-binding LacI/PurR family transcriptional regulator